MGVCPCVKGACLCRTGHISGMCIYMCVGATLEQS